MRVVIQRVNEASVLIDNNEVNRINKGILVLLGIGDADTEREADFLLDKIVNLRIFEDDQGKMNLSLIDVDGEIMIVSQFTLLGDCRKGRRPSFTDAAPPEVAGKLCDYFVEQAKKKVKKVGTGEFQAYMEVKLANDGPVTFVLDSK